MNFNVFLKCVFCYVLLFFSIQFSVGSLADREKSFWGALWRWITYGDVKISFFSGYSERKLVYDEEGKPKSFKEDTNFDSGVLERPTFKSVLGLATLKDMVILGGVVGLASLILYKAGKSIYNEIIKNGLRRKIFVTVNENLRILKGFSIKDIIVEVERLVVSRKDYADINSKLKYLEISLGDFIAEEKPEIYRILLN